MDEERIENIRECLLTKYQAFEQGFWEVKGEDENADFGGHHHMPSLGVFEGRYADVVEYAIHLNRFWTWGAGGSIAKVNIQHIKPNTVKELKETRKELTKLNERKKTLEAKLEHLEQKT